MAIRSRKEREKEQRRKEIIDTAEKLFFERGYDHVSMNDIAKDVELNKATLYLYFNNKEDLFFAAVLRGTKIMVAMIKKEVGNEQTGINKISAFRRAYNKFVEKYPDYYWTYCYFQSGRFDINDMVNRIYAEELSREARLYNLNITPNLDAISLYAMEIIELRHEMFAIIRDSIIKGIEEKSIRADIKPVETAVILTVMAESIQTIRPDLIKILESCGINQEAFKDDFGVLVSYMLLER